MVLDFGVVQWVCKQGMCEGRAYLRENHESTEQRYGFFVFTIFFRLPSPDHGQRKILKMLRCQYKTSVLTFPKKVCMSILQTYKL